MIFVLSFTMSIFAETVSNVATATPEPTSVPTTTATTATVTTTPTPTATEGTTPTPTPTTTPEKITFDYTYENYLADHPGLAKAKSDVLLDNSKAVLTNASLINEADGKSNVITVADSGIVEYPVEIMEDGMYSVRFMYDSMLQAANREYKLSLTIDGTSPFEAARYVVLTKLWKDEIDAKTGRFNTDSRGNELTPKQLEVKGWQENYIEDAEGYYREPYTFYFTKGMHKVSFQFQAGGIILSEIRLKNPLPLQSYASYLKGNSDKKQVEGTQFDTYQAEKSLLKSDPVLHPVYDRTSSATTPQDPAKLLQNTIGQQNWKYKGQWISWKVTAPEDGMYKIVMRARQNYLRGVRVSRKIYINGEVPFAEFENYTFPFSNRWYIDVLEAGDKPYLVYLKKGDNEIKMEVSPSYPEIVRKLQQSVLELNSLYRKIIMITGVAASGNALDEYRDYELDKEIPGFLNLLKKQRDSLVALRAEMTKSGFQKGGEAVVVEELIRQMDSFILDTDTIPLRLKMFKDNISAASSWVLRLKEQPLELDWIAVAAADAKIPNAENGFFANTLFSAQTFMASFFNDYNNLDSGYKAGEAIEVWVGLGREQTQLIKQLVDDFFIPKYNVKINVNLVQQGLIPATLTGKGPDVAMFVTPSDIVNLAARNALVSVSEFSGFNDTIKQFQKASIIPYTYMDKAYGIPVNETFFMMFYRKDVFSELGILPPKTWTEFYDLILALQRSNLTIGMPSDEMTFQNLVFQLGGSYYKGNDWKETAFDSPEVLSAFKQWTEFFTKYTLPVAYDFYSRFRTGEMPLGIAPYTMYNQLNVSAPEIKGLWEMTQVPGTLKADGSIDNSATGGGTGVTMFNKTENREGAWEFMKWWTSSEIQAKYGREIEIIMGPAARYDTANIEAFKNLPWTDKEKAQLLKQWSSLKMIKQTPVNYYITRNLANAFRKVVINGENPRETLNFYNRDIGKEIVRKRAEFGLN